MDEYAPGVGQSMPPLSQMNVFGRSLFKTKGVASAN